MQRTKLQLTEARPNDIDRLVAIHASSFPDGRGFPERRANFQDNPRGTLRDLFVARTSTGAIVGHAFLFRMRTFIAGGEVALSGLASLGVAAEARGQGVGRAIIEGLLDESERRGDAMQLLYPFSYRYYASLGFAPVSPIVRLRVPASALPHASFARRCLRATTADVGAISAMYQRAARSSNGLLARSEALIARMLARPGQVAFVVRGETGAPDANRAPDESVESHENHGDDVRGWVLFRFVEVASQGEIELHVRELVAVDDEARRALLGVVAVHRDQVGTIELSLSEGDPLPMLVSEPRAAHAPFVPGHLHPLGQLAAGPMVRPIDVRRLLLARGYRTDGSVNLRVSDPRSNVALRLEVAQSTPRVSELAVSDRALSLDVATLGAIAVGALRPSDAMRHGLLAGDEAEVANADRLFATDAPFRCLDEF